MRIQCCIIIVVLFFSCNYKIENKQIEIIKVPFQETSLKNTCSNVIKKIENDSHGMHYFEDKREITDIDTIKKILYSISLLDNFNEKNSFRSTSDHCEFYIKIDTNDNVYKLIKTSISIEFPENSKLNYKNKTQIKIQDFDLYLKNNKRKITIRILDDSELISLKINTREIIRVSESIPIELPDLIHKLDSIKDLEINSPHL